MKTHSKKITALVLGALVLGAATAQSVQAKEVWRVYVGGYNTDDSFGINYGAYDPATATLSLEGLAVATDNPSYLVSNQEGTFIYCVNETASFEGSGTVSAFSVDTATGKLREISKLPTRGTYPCHLTLDGKEKRLYVANYGSGSMITFPVDQKTGELSAATAFFQYSGTGVDKSRQEGPHAHSVTFDPKSRSLYCCDLGTDQIAVYVANRTGIPLTAASTPFVKAKAGSGPRQMAFHPDKPYAYVLNELDNTVSFYLADFDTLLWKKIKKGTFHSDGALQLVESWSVLPPEFEGKNTASALRVHPNGKFLYASNRGHDSIALFSINQKTGKLNPLGHIPSGGKTPRDMAIHPDGKSLIVANQDSNTLTTFLLNPATGELTASGVDAVATSKPSCVAFVPVYK